MQQGVQTMIEENIEREKKYIFLIEESHSQDKEDRNQLKQLIVDLQQLLGYEDFAYLLTPEKGKQVGLYGIDDWFLSIFANFVHMYTILVLGKEKDIQIHFDKTVSIFKNYKNNTLEYYDQHYKIIEQAISQIAESLKTKDIESIEKALLENLIKFVPIAFDHPHYQSEMQKNFDQQKIINVLNLFSQKGFGYINDQICHQKNPQIVNYLNYIHEVIILQMRNLSFGYGIKEIIIQTDKPVNVFVMGEKHVEDVCQRLIQDNSVTNIAEIKVVSYSECFQQLNTLFPEEDDFVPNEENLDSIENPSIQNISNSMNKIKLEKNIETEKNLSLNNLSKMQLNFDEEDSLEDENFAQILLPSNTNNSFQQNQENDKKGNMFNKN